MPHLAMPRRKQVIDAATLANRRLARGRLGRLADQRVKPVTQQLYRLAVHRYLHWCYAADGGVAASLAELDGQCCRYIERLWEDGDSKSQALRTLSGIQFFLFERRVLTRSWKLCKVWSRLELPARAPPMPVSVMLGLVGWALTVISSVELAATCACGRHCLLRTGEMLSLAPAHICVSNSWQGVVALPWSKIGQQRGTQEMVTVSEPLVGWLLHRASTGKLPNQPFAPREAEFRQLFAAGVAHFGLQNLCLKPYSFRRGGASYDFAVTGDLPRTLWRGRWCSSETGRIYIQEGVAMQAQMRISPESQIRLDVAVEALRLWVGRAALQPPHAHVVPLPAG